ncbi:MAG: hypothetical protein WBV64_05275, partial [Mycobacterium sp.]
TAAALCPHPMELVPGLTAVSDDRWAPLRTACLNAVAQLGIPVAGGAHVRGPDAPQLVVIVGGDQVTRRFDSTTAYASLLGAGVWWESGWGQAAEDPQPLPLSLSLGYWLLTASRPGNTGMIACDVEFEAVNFHASPQACLTLGAQLAARAERVAFIVMGEGMTCVPPAHRTVDLMQSDAAFRDALEGANTESLRRLGYTTMTGRAPWQVLAGAAGTAAFDTRIHGSAPHNAPVISWRRQ